MEFSHYQHLSEWSGWITEQEYREVCWSGSVTVGGEAEGVSHSFTSLSLVAPTISLVAVTSPTPKPSEILCCIGAMEEIQQIKSLKLLSFHPTSSVVHHLSIQVSSNLFTQRWVVITFFKDKCFILFDTDQRGLVWNTTVGRKWKP